MREAISVVYLTSAPFSGSTLLSFLANTHPQIASVGEMTGPTPTQDPEVYKCSCGLRIRQCAFWTSVAECMASKGLDFDPGKFDTRFRLGHGFGTQRVLSGSLGSSVLEDVRDNLLRLLPLQYDRLQSLTVRARELASCILRVSGKSMLFDASKNHMTIRYLRKLSGIDLRVVHLVRDVRGASLSMRKNKGGADWGRAVNSWRKANRNIQRQLKRLPGDRWIRIRYEDLCHSPDAILNRIFDFCGLRPHSLPGDFRSIDHHIVGNRMRLAGIGEVQLNEDWRHVLTPADLQTANQIAGAMHAQYGYPVMRVTDLKSRPSS